MTRNLPKGSRRRDVSEFFKVRLGESVPRNLPKGSRRREKQGQTEEEEQEEEEEESP